MQVRAWTYREAGGPSVLTLERVALPPPGPGDVQIRHEAVGLNYIDVYYRSGAYPAALPSGLGIEAAGVVTALGEGVEDFAIGDRVAYAGGPLGAYAQARNLPAVHCVALPPGIASEVAAAGLLKGMTAEYLLRRAHRVGPGTSLLFHAGAGGVGAIAGQWLRALGVRAIATAGGPEKCAAAAAFGFAEVIDYRACDVAARVLDLTGGAGVDVVYDGVGRDTFEASLACLKPRGLLVAFGAASGPVPPVALGALARKSLYLTRPTLAAYTATPADLQASAGALFAVIEAGHVTVPVQRRYAFEDAVQAHRDLEGRRTTGSSILVGC